jgi:hypothetical protein
MTMMMWEWRRIEGGEEGDEEVKICCFSMK